MQLAQLIVHGAEGRLLELLRESAQGAAVWLREAARPASCLSLLRSNPASVVVLKWGKDLDRELALLEHISDWFPATATLVVGHVEHPALAALAWDLGARFVLFPPQPIDKLRAVLAGFLPGPAYSRAHAGGSLSR